MERCLQIDKIKVIKASKVTNVISTIIVTLIKILKIFFTKLEKILKFTWKTKTQKAKSIVNKNCKIEDITISVLT